MVEIKGVYLSFATSLFNASHRLADEGLVLANNRSRLFLELRAVRQLVLSVTWT